MAFRKKAASILKYKPDILVVPECEHSDKLKFDDGLPKPKDHLWFGLNQHKGLGVFCYSELKLSVFEDYNPAFRMIIPLEVTGENFSFNLFAVWANNPADPDGQYVEQVWKALHYYEQHLSGKPTILMGDFNSNTIWDRKRRAGNHSSVVKFLEEKNIFSSYHFYKKQEQGKEKHPTLYLYRHKDKPYHLDYCFMSADLLHNVSSVVIGKYDAWAMHSDHVPVIVTFNVDGDSIK